MIQNCPRRCPGLATPLSDLGNVLAISPMLYVQLRLGEVASPALVDSGAGDNFIDSGLVSPLQLKPLHLAVLTIIRSANGRPMDTYVVLVLPGFESVCHGFFYSMRDAKKTGVLCLQAITDTQNMPPRSHSNQGQPKVLCTDPPRVALDSFYWQG